MERTQRIYVIDDRTQEWQCRTTELPGRTRQLPKAIVARMQKEQRRKSLSRVPKKSAVVLSLIFLALAFHRGTTGFWLPSFSINSVPVQRSSRIADSFTQRDDAPLALPSNDESAYREDRQRNNAPSSNSSPWLLPVPRYGSVPPPVPTLLDGH